MGQQFARGLAIQELHRRPPPFFFIGVTLIPKTIRNTVAQGALTQRW